MRTDTQTDTDQTARAATSLNSGGKARMMIAPKNYEYAIKRSCLDLETISKVKRFKDLPEWISGEKAPTFNQLYDLAQKTKTPFGLFFATEPPPLPVDVGIKDFRIRKDQGFGEEIREVREVISKCEYRQDWLSQYLQDTGHNRKSWIGMFSIANDPSDAALFINSLIPRPEHIRDKRKFLNTLVELIEQIGVMVNISSTVGTDNRRKLQANWFGGFSLSDQFAPLIFVNGSDHVSARIFTLIHEFAHLLLDNTGIDDASPMQSNNPIEVWCNQTSGNYLVPTNALEVEIATPELQVDDVTRLSNAFNVSNLVIIKRLFDTGYLTRDKFEAWWHMETQNLQTVTSSSKTKGRADFYARHRKRLGILFSNAVLEDTYNGSTSIFEAEDLLGVDGQTFANYAGELGSP